MTDESPKMTEQAKINTPAYLFARLSAANKMEEYLYAGNQNKRAV